MNEDMVMYRCPECGEIEYANAEDGLVTCSNGHHLTIGDEPDEEGFVSAEVIDE